ncbi:rhomboid family intramembrane serine protease [Streptomyces sp. NPDC057067]|uniref:Rhomboid family intramembrane serine protease n=2 Tax=Streptomyces TaxID=1883 RepID=A0AAU1LP84_9ACTN|nr:MULTISPECIES: rhomboid family intramembrane serine protease [Streptomyces]MBL1288750.1 rhomboid family intramembrane serine protease [Streptomyces silvae]MDX3325048.1 rhomboid family intramembrane serine protease [Streptomyces sp. ME02-6979-3A]MDX3685990.1 rhomboid family intramembrane serine protease [Streptomyces sp. AK04-4c]WSS75429.1 rhomboid family intramembrane serine protease [Streptomyces sp. NBC_01174]
MTDRREVLWRKRFRELGAAASAGGAPVTYGLIALCCAVFLISPLSGFNPAHGTADALLAAQAGYFERWGVIPSELMDGSARAALTPLTALFVHGSWLHLLGNMLFLYVFGAMAEERMGRVEFTFFYLLCGYFALVAYAVVHAGSDQTLVGASGAISAVLGAFLCLFPRARVTSLFPFLFFLPLRFPAWIVLVFWFVLQWLAAQSAGSGPGVAYLAHVAGFSAGFLYAWVRFRGTRVKSPATATEGESQP